MGSVWKGRWGWQTRCCSHNSPPAPRRLRLPSLFPPTGETAEAERSGQGSALHPSRAARPSPCKPERFSQSCAVMAGMWGLARAGQAAQRLLSHGLQHRLCPLRSPVPPPRSADKDDPGLRACLGSIPVPSTSCSPSGPSLQHMLVHSSSVKSLLVCHTPPHSSCGSAPQSLPRVQACVSHGGTAATEPSHTGWMFSKCFGGRPQHVPPSGRYHSVICLHRQKNPVALLVPTWCPAGEGAVAHPAKPCTPGRTQPTTLWSPSKLLEAPRHDSRCMHAAFHPSHLATGTP